MRINIPEENTQLTREVVPTLTKFYYSANGRALQTDSVVSEQPLQIRLSWHDSVSCRDVSQVFSITMRTPDDDKALIIGLLLSEGVIQSIEQLASVTPEADTTANAHYTNQWEAKLALNVTPDIKSLERFQVTYSSCGLCGTTSLKSLELKNPPILEESEFWLAFTDICELPIKMRAQQKLFKRTGGTHAAALFDDSGQLLDLKEDIGRHNALDKLLGTRLMNEAHLSARTLVVVSGRISFEIVQKTVMAGISVLIAVGAPSDLAILAAKRFNLTLIGFTTNQGFNVYHGEWRILPMEGSCQKI